MTITQNNRPIFIAQRDRVKTLLALMARYGSGVHPSSLDRRVRFLTFTQCLDLTA